MNFKIERTNTNIPTEYYETLQMAIVKEFQKYYQKQEEELKNYIKENGIDEYLCFDVFRTSTKLGEKITNGELYDAIDFFCEEKGYEARYIHFNYLVQETNFLCKGDSSDLSSYEYNVFLCSNNRRSNLPINKLKEYL
ncbi:hypothetical protein [Cytobacillus sp. NCCP-133]|uniref:hypothetical protein n=1 Tax=Cytobacillus sp. NCCP-133 TaxID=766848 RepID=UPI00222F1A80|nr:hypothetical protein [Cytobacillus sp. NCCP-133]GLB58662.1 hypothetical protein NCCP133_07950 [Cytobacillus sp. NCCP-133]